MDHVLSLLAGINIAVMTSAALSTAMHVWRGWLESWACCWQAVEGSPIKPTQAARDERGRVNLDELTDADLDYGTDERSLASLRRRLKRATYTYEGDPSAALSIPTEPCAHSELR